MRSAVASAAAVPAAPFSIEEYKLKRKIELAAAKKPRQRASTANSTAASGALSTSARTLSSSRTSRSNSNVSALYSTTTKAAPTYSKAQKQYLDFCVDKFVEPDMKLLSAVREGGFLLKLDPFGDEELDAHMDFVQKHAAYRQICVSLGSVEIKRDLRNKFDRLGIKRGAAFTEHGASSVIKAVSTAALKTTHLIRLEIVGVRIQSTLAPLLAKAIVSCSKLEFVSFAQTRLGDASIEAVAVPLGKCPSLQQLSLAGCHLTDKARDHITKIVTLHGVLKDESVWSSSLRGETASVAAARPALLLDLSHNALGDATADALCDALYHDKWLLGLNVSRNRITRAGIARFVDTLAQSNRTLAVLVANEMKEPVDQMSVHRLETLLHERKAHLQHVAFETREKRLLLCSVLLEWRVNRELVLEICQSSDDRRDASAQSSMLSSSQSVVSEPLTRHRWRDDRASTTRSRSNQDDESDDTDENEDDNGARAHRSAESESSNQRHVSTHCRQHQPKATATRSPQRTEKRSALRRVEDRSVSATETHMAHLQTIKLLTERMSAMEDEQRRVRAYMNNLEIENEQLRSQLQMTSGMSSTEERIIARLEDTISSLAHQVGELALEKAAAATDDSGETATRVHQDANRACHDDEARSS